MKKLPYFSMLSGWATAGAAASRASRPAEITLAIMSVS
jgi:hypothetical protein